VGRAYDGPDLPKSSIATVVFDDTKQFWTNQRLILCKVDEVKVQMSSERVVDVLPGEHKVLFIYQQGGGGGKVSAVELTFTAEAGKKYLITFDKKSYLETMLQTKFALWIEDIQTGEHLQNIKSSPLMSQFACF
jgi:hypothetical protein